MVTNEENQQRLQSLVREQQKRKIEVLKVFRPLSYQLRIFTSSAPELIVRGGNRSGKTTAASILFASLALNRPVIGMDGDPLPRPWPASWGRDHLLMWVVGYDEKHIGQTIFHHLFEPGIFRLIKDLETGEYRIFRPWDEQDVERSIETIQSEPLIPDRYIDSWSWKDKAANVFESVRLTNGTEIRAYSSRGNPKQGDKVHCIWIDEDIEYASHIGEFRARLADYGGRLLWSAFPHSKNEALVEMSEMAEEQKTWDKPIVEEVKVSLLDNPFIRDDQKHRIGITLTDENERSARIEGNFTYDSVLVYPTFNKRIHCSPCENDLLYDEIDRILAKNERPMGWSRYLAIDPGFTRTAAVFAAVPPPSMFEELPDDEKYVIIEGEVYVKGKGVDDIAKLVREWTQGFVYEAFIIDWHAARQTPMVGGKIIYQQYQEAFAKQNVRSLEGNTFRRGNDDIAGRIEIVRSYLTVNRKGKPRLRINANTTPGLQKEFAKYKYRQTSTGFIDEKPVKKNDHALDALGYLLSIEPQYVERDYSMSVMSPAFRAFQAIQERAKAKAMQGNRVVNLGPSG